jgi:outer membrane protein OmpA-like peptidoglycan-associated protein
MSFDYNRNKHQHSGDSFWTSYSDLFLGLSTIFLLLYVMASLRTGTDAIKSQVDNQKLTMQLQEKESQLKMYEQVKADYLEKQASKDEVQEYKELMDKLTLLKEEAKTDQERLAREALETEQKANALNKYQQLVRNIINANKMAKVKITNRNDIIDEQDETIDDQKKDITDLKQVVSQNEQEISTTKDALEKNKKRLMAAYRENKLSKAQFEKKKRDLQEQAESKLQELQAQNKNYNQQIDQINSELKGTQAALNAKSQEANSLKGEIDSIKSNFEKERARDRAALDAEIRKGKMDAAERARREGEFKAAAAKKEQEMQGRIAGLNGALAKAKEEMDARRDVAREIKKGFAAAGIKADVDMQTGEVVLDFGDAYFESDSANLKPEMESIIRKAMPVYSKSLFGNQKVASKISSVEIIGFASPTYKGRFVDPESSKPDDKTALRYNMDLSIKRANSIFNYLVENRDTDPNLHQKELMTLMKVSGRSFLEVMKMQGRKPTNAADFCKQNDCRKAQRVIVRFGMDGKK